MAFDSFPDSTAGTGKSLLLYAIFRCPHDKEVNLFDQLRRYRRCQELNKTEVGPGRLLLL